VKRMRQIGLLVAALLLCVATVADATFSAARVSCGTSATLLAAGGQYGMNVLVLNKGTADVFLGGADVTTAAGFELDAGAAVPTPLGAQERLYCIVASGTERVDVLKRQ
jgi:hypothetical protein